MDCQPERCPICLESGGTERAPCGFDAPMFHAHCLEAHGDAGATQCPHCNASAPSVGLRRVRRLLDGWLKTGGLWRRSPLFVPLQRGLMRGQGETHALREVVGHAVGSMLTACAARKEETIVYAARRTHTKQYFVMYHNNGREATEVVLQRSAVFSALGVACCDDGYIISASRRRRRKN